MPHTIHAIGLMSGSSLDGLDMAFCRFELEEELENPLTGWSLLGARTTPFSTEWQERLRRAPESGGLALMQTHADFGHYMGRLLQPFLSAAEKRVDLIASHGHTVFHYPGRRMTCQIGDGAALAAVTGITVIDNFRALDVALGGQGAPLAPLADRMLFPGYDFYLNLGGIANLSARVEDRFVAFDVSGANQVLNALVAPLGLPFDENGRIAAAGRLKEGLLREAEALDFFQRSYPKSLGNDWVQEKLLPLFQSADLPPADKLHTMCIHLARQIAAGIAAILAREGFRRPAYRLFITGGGAHNRFLVECIRAECEKICSLAIVIPEPDVISYKEAALMALMGVLRLFQIPNCLSSVTGARHDAIGGAIHSGG
jgi:anhydro-N-acetylmuramic acid kinase